MFKFVLLMEHMALRFNQTVHVVILSNITLLYLSSFCIQEQMSNLANQLNLHAKLRSGSNTEEPGNRRAPCSLFSVEDYTRQILHGFN